MELIERYVQAIGRALPDSQREDILSELRSSLYDTLEAEAGGDSLEAQAAVIKRMGPPQEVAASYYPQGQYLIGPALYPLFKRVIGIVFTAVVGAQLLAILLAVVLDGAHVRFPQELWDIIGSLPPALGFVVLLFWGLQRLDVQPHSSDSFDPHKLPPLEAKADGVSRFEQLFNILFGVLFLIFLASFAQNVSFAWKDGSGFFENPVLQRYFPWLAFSMILGIVLDVILLWQGRWQRATRIAYLASNLFGLLILGLLLQGHQNWLAAAGFPQLVISVDQLAQMGEAGAHLIGMAVFRLVLAVIALIVVVDTLIALYRLIRAEMRTRRITPAQYVSAVQ